MRDWPHAPLHRFEREGAYFVTGATYLKHHYYRTRERLDRLQDRLFALAREHHCALEAWALLSNHYHLVARAAGEELRLMLTRIHTLEGIDCNQEDGQSGRKVWYQFRDTQLTFERSWLARLRYTHHNAVHHGLVAEATSYPWCSAAWFERTASPAFSRVLTSLKIDRVSVPDDFEPEPLV